METIVDRPVAARAADVLLIALDPWGVPDPARLESVEHGTALVWQTS